MLRPLVLLAYALKGRARLLGFAEPPAGRIRGLGSMQGLA